MLIARGMLAAFCFAAIVLAIVQWLSFDSPFHEPPKIASESQISKEQPQNDCSTFRCTVIVPIGNFIHDNRDEITAISTAIIAIFTTILGLFTVSLARSTRVAANAANLSAKAAIALQLPII